jgi:hypothetical protein
MAVKRSNDAIERMTFDNMRQIGVRSAEPQPGNHC